MYNRKAIPQRKVKKSRLLVSDFSGGINAYADENVLPFKYAQTGYNFCAENGALCHCKGFEVLKIKGMQTAMLNYYVVNMYYFRCYDTQTATNDDKFIVIIADGTMHYLQVNDVSAGFKPLTGCNFSSVPSGINYRLNGEDVIIFCTPSNPMTVWNGKDQPYRVEHAPLISSMCIHYERLFASVVKENNRIWFSDDLDPTNWDVSLDEAGYIDISGDKGDVLKVISFLDYVYVFQSYGISRITAYGEQSEFSVITLYTSAGRIYPQTLAVCGDRIIFAAQDGIYTFDGIKTTKILRELFPLFIGGFICARAAYYNGKYFLACKLNYGEEEQYYMNNALIEYDISKRTFNIIKGVNINSMEVIPNGNLCTLALGMEGEHGRYVLQLAEENTFIGQPLPKMWKTFVTDFNCPDRYKLIREFFVYTETPIKVTIYSESGSTQLNFEGGGLCGKKVNIKAKSFYAEFYCETPRARISRPTITVDIL